MSEYFWLVFSLMGFICLFVTVDLITDALKVRWGNKDDEKGGDDE